MRYLFIIIVPLSFTMAQTMERTTQTVQNSDTFLTRSITEKRGMAARAIPIFVPYFALMGGLCGVAAHTAGVIDSFSDPASSFVNGAALGSAAACITINWLTDHI